MLADSDLRIIFKLLQASCLAPYKIGKDRGTSKRSVLLVFYSLSFTAFVMYNLVHAENDTRNNVDYDNKSFLIGIAFDTVDVLENIHPCFICLRALIFSKASIDIWFKISSINQEFKQMNIDFDHGKLKKYISTKVFCFVALSLLFLYADIILCGKLGIFYTANYWISCAIPLIQNSVIAAGFGGLVLILYQRYWAINELIIRAANCHKEAWVDLSWQQIKYEKLGGNHLHRYYLNQSVNFKKCRIRPTAKSAWEKPPFLTMLKNYECLGKDVYNERNFASLIRFLKVLHFDLFEVTKDVNSIFGWNLLFVFVTAFFGITINLYFVIIYHIKAYDTEEYISCLMWMSMYFFKIIYLIAYATKTSKEIRIPAVSFAESKNCFHFRHNELSTYFILL